MKHDITLHIAKAREEAFAARRKMDDSWDKFREHEDMFVEAIRSIENALDMLSRARTDVEWLEENVR